MLEFISAWYNIPFLVTLLVAVGLATIGALGLLHHDTGADLDSDGGVDHDTDSDVDNDAHGANDHGFHWTWLAWFGVGRAPLTILVNAFLFTFSFIGLTVNAVAFDLVGWLPHLVFPVSLGLAVVGSLAAVKGVGRLFDRYLPNDRPTSRRSGAFVGFEGKAASSISPSIGQILVDPLDGNPVALLNAKCGPGVNLIARDALVRLVGYEPSASVYLVVPKEQT